METREYVEYLLDNYLETIKDLEQLKFEYETFKDIASDELIEALNFSCPTEDRVSSSSISDKTCNIALIYREVAKRMNRESRKEIYKMIKAVEFEMARLNYCIERLEPKVKEVIKEIFINKVSWNEICEKCSISEKTLNKYRKRGIEDLALMLSIGRLAI